MAETMTAKGKFGQFGGQFVPETLMPALLDLEAAYEAAKADPAFQDELAWYFRHYGGRPTRSSPGSKGRGSSAAMAPLS